MDYKSSIDLNNLPKHIAIIMDGNGRWAKENGKPRVFGHQNGVKSVRATTEAAAEIGIEHLTLYAFSTENWNRPKIEVTALMTLLVETINKEIDTMMKNNIRLSAIGEIEKLPKKTYKALLKGMERTSNNDRMTLTLALNYSSRSDIKRAIHGIVEDSKSGKLDGVEISDDLVSSYLSTAKMPEPELLIRTSGEHRISNFLLWEISYTEFYFTDIFWPDFGKEEFYKAIFSFQSRERRFGKTGDQILKRINV